MKKQMMFAAVAVAMATVSLGASAQNVAIVNGKAVPKARVEALAQQLARSGRPVTPDIESSKCQLMAKTTSHQVKKSYWQP